jgi:hypothetical protein
MNSTVLVNAMILNRTAIFTTGRLHPPFTVSACLLGNLILFIHPLYPQLPTMNGLDPDGWIQTHIASQVLTSPPSDHPEHLNLPPTWPMAPSSTVDSPGLNRTIFATTYRPSSDQLTPPRPPSRIPGCLRRSRNRMKTEIYSSNRHIVQYCPNYWPFATNTHI